MTSTPPRQDGSAMAPDTNPTQGPGQYLASGPTGFASQAPLGSQYPVRSPMPPITQGQTPRYTFRPPSNIPSQGPGYAYRPPSSAADQNPGFAYRPPTSQQASAAGSVPSTAFGQIHQRAPAPSPFLPPNAGSSSAGSAMPPPPNQTAAPYSKSPVLGPFLTGQPVNPMAASGFSAATQTAAPAQLPMPGQIPSGSFPTTGGNRPGVPGPFSATQLPLPSSNQAVRTEFGQSPVTNSLAIASSRPPLNQNALSPYATAAPGNQVPMPFPTVQAANQAAQSTSFSSQPIAAMTASARGPPVYGLPSGAIPGTFTAQGFPSSAVMAPAFPGQMSLPPGQVFPGQIGSQGLPPPALPHVPAAVGQVQAPSFGQSTQPGLQASQYPQYAGAPPSIISDGQLNRGPFPYPGVAAPFQNMQGLAEEFQSLTLVSAPGSMESSVDPSALPRPAAETEYPPSLIAGNCSGRYFRLTCSPLPNSQSLAARWHLPLGAVAHPLAQAPLSEEVPVIDFGSYGIIRCRRCRTYINPFATFTDNGRRWKCNLCSLNNEVPPEYYCPVDQTGRRTDADERPELSRGSAEFIAPAEYMIRPPMPPVYFFLIDVSSSAMKTGMLQIAADTIRSCLDKLPGYPRTQIGFLTFDSTLHFYSLKSALTQPQMMVVADLDDPFLPMPDDLLVNLSESRAVVDTLLNSLPSMFKDNLNVESAVGPALRAVFMILSQLGGKLLLFQSTLPSLGVGRLKTRGDDLRVYGTDKEPSLRSSEDPFYKQMAADFSKFQICVNLYAFGDSYIDLASLGTLSKYTAGQVYYYQSFQPHLSGEKFSYELARDLTRETAWEAVLRIRCGKGLRFSTYHGHFMQRSSDLMALPAVDCDKAFAMQLTLEDTLLTTQTAYFQSALLYTSSNGERRIRVHTAAAPVTSDLNEMYRGADTGAIVMLMSRLALEKSLVSKLDDVRQQQVQARLVRALREYQNMFGVQHPLTGRLIYPESLKLLPLYCLSLYKCIPLRGGYGGAKLDERLSASFEMMVMPIPRLLTYLYPTMFRLDDSLNKGAVDVKSIQPLPLTAERLDSRGAFVVNDGLKFIVWLGSVLPMEFSVQLLGMEAVQSGDLRKVAVVEQGNDLSKKFMSLLKSLRLSNPALHQQCHFVQQGDQPREGFLVLFNLVEDRPAGSIGYADWMVQIFRQVKQKA